MNIVADELIGTKALSVPVNTAGL